METQALALIQEMLSLTQKGKLSWTKIDYDRFEATIANKHFQVEFLFLARTDEVGSDRIIARLNAFNLMFDYCVGTQGFDIICEMLAVSDPEWMAARGRGQKQFAEAMAFLQRMQDT